jgi:FkbM family methyltransferase
MTIDILVVSFSRDAEWFRRSLEVNRKNLTGFRNIVLVTPHQDHDLFQAIVAGLPNVVHVTTEDWPGQGYYWQQAQKMSADTFSDADVIAHIDSDVFVKAPTDMRDYFADNKPSILWQWYTDAGNAVVWKAPTERAYGTVVHEEFMCGFPQIYHRSVYAQARKHLEEAHKMPWQDYIRKMAAHPQQPAFSEFNFLGAVAKRYEGALYNWVDRNRDEWPKGFANTRQFWSHAPLDDCLPEIDQMLDGRREHQLEVTNRGIWILSNDTHISKWVQQAQRLDFDTPTLEKHLKFIKPGDTVVDAGANIGDNTIAYARATAGVATGYVLAFEPNPLAFECLRRNMAGHSHVQCERLGLSDEHSSGELAIGPNAGAAYLTPGESIKVAPLDQWNLPRLAFMKIDVEGYEPRVLRGAVETIRRCHPVMYIEINPGALERAGFTAETVRSWLIEEGYRIEGWVDGSPQFDIYAYPEKPHTQ